MGLTRLLFILGRTLKFHPNFFNLKKMRFAKNFTVTIKKNQRKKFSIGLFA